MNTDNRMNYMTMNTQADDDEEESLDLLELGSVLLSKLWVLILFAVIGAGAAGIITSLFVTPKYNATSMIYIYSKTTSVTSLVDLQLGSQLAVDFTIVATTREVMEKVIESANLEMSYDALLGCVSVYNPTGSHVLEITATHSDPEMAAKISNSVANELRSRIADVMNTDEPSMVERAVVPTSPSSPKPKLNILLGGAGAAFVAAACVVIIYLMDDTIKTEEDVKRYLNLNVLAEIPAERSQKKSTKAAKKTKKAKTATAKRAAG